MNRGTANIRSARLYDPDAKTFVGQTLRWSKERSLELEKECTLEPGSNKSLYVFASEKGSGEYFPYASKSLDSEPYDPQVFYRDINKEFSIELTDTIGHKYRFDFTVSYKATTGVSMRPNVTWRHRRYYLRQSFEYFVKAFTPN